MGGNGAQDLGTYQKGATMLATKEIICERNGWRLYGQSVYCEECGEPQDVGDTVYVVGDNEHLFCSKSCAHLSGFETPGVPC